MCPSASLILTYPRPWHDVNLLSDDSLLQNVRRVGSGHDLHIAVKLKQYFSSVLFVRSLDVVKGMGRVPSLQEFAFLTIVHATAVSEKKFQWLYYFFHEIIVCLDVVYLSGCMYV